MKLPKRHSFIEGLQLQLNARGDSAPGLHGKEKTNKNALYHRTRAAASVYCILLEMHKKLQKLKRYWMCRMLKRICCRIVERGG